MKPEVQGSIPALGKDSFALFYKDTKEIDVIKNHRPISRGPFFRRRSIGPLPSSWSGEESIKDFSAIGATRANTFLISYIMYRISSYYL